MPAARQRSRCSDMALVVLNFAVDGYVLAGIIDTDLNETEQDTQEAAAPDGQPGLLV